MTDIIPEQNMWFPGPDAFYQGREGDYAKSAIKFNRPDLVQLVKQRVEADTEWVLENHRYGEHEDIMHKMAVWASREQNIVQCFNSNAGNNPTVDWICRELANAAKKIAEGSHG
jgi:hypothetical protein